ncbi:MAG: hypothetical protein NKF70_00120 [Methanobacterium sp. ERen5]|nr:MAG: hypothetical protein NKF70_00120 [Methanobacterium sp. ERen5]
MVVYLGNSKNVVINNAVSTISAELSKDATERLNYKKSGTYVKRPIQSKTAELYYDNNEAIANVVDIKQEDLIKSNFIHIESELQHDILEFYETLLNNNKTEFSLIIADYALFGAGAGEILVIDENNVKVDHVPQTLLEIILVKDKEGIEYPLVEVKDYTNKVVGYNRLFNFAYPDNFITANKGFELGQMLWYGSGQFNDFYDKPFYFQLVQDILSEMAVKECDTKTFNNGNQTSGIVYINKTGVQSLKVNRPFKEVEYDPDNLPEDDPDPVTAPPLPANVETLKTEIGKAGFGNSFFYEETDDPMAINYINLTNNNQDYVLKKLDKYKTEIYRRAKIPQERLMDSSVKESMNSQKTVAIWTIYLKSLDSSQQDFEQLLSDYLFFVYDETLDISIDVPEFEEFKIARAQLVISLFNNAGLTHENYIKQLNNIYEWVDTDNLNEWFSKEYFFNGKMLSDMVAQPTSDSTDAAGGMFDFNING